MTLTIIELSDFIRKLRMAVFDSHPEAGNYFNLDRTRFLKYEDARYDDKPKLGCLAELVRLNVDQAEDKQEAQRSLLQEVNRFAWLYGKRGQLFGDWNELCHDLPPKKWTRR